MGDFDRFKLYKAKTKRNRIIKNTYCQLRRAYRYRKATTPKEYVPGKKLEQKPKKSDK